MVLVGEDLDSDDMLFRSSWLWFVVFGCGMIGCCVYRFLCIRRRRRASYTSFDGHQAPN